MKDVYKTISSDIENNFDLIHIDFSKYKKNYSSILKESKKAILFAKNVQRQSKIYQGQLKECQKILARYK